MTFDITTICITNFRSFKGKCRFEFPSTCGLYNITGNNLDNPRLTPNGSGKSTLLEAIIWCLYGKTSRGLKATDVVSWGERSCSVVLKVAGRVVARTQTPNALVLDGKPITQEALEKQLQLNYECFKHAVIFPQFHQAFFDLAPAEKLNLFSDIMELELWLDKSQAADVKAKGLAEAKRHVEDSITRYEARLSAMADDIKGLKAKDKEFDVAQAITVKKLLVEVGLARKARHKLEEELKYSQQAKDNAERRIKLLKEDDSYICSKCKQLVVNEEAQKRLRTLKQNFNDFEREVIKLQRECERLDYQCTELLTKADAERHRHSPYAEMVTEKVQERLEVKAKFDEARLLLALYNEEHAAYSYWVGGFKKLRLMVVEEALAKLEVEVNNNLASLGLTDWRVEFDVERENKSGGVTKGFVVLIHAPGHAKPVRWEVWSGGETQRLRLAGNLGLANLIMERAGLVNRIEFYDEPSTYLGQQGLLDLAETLSDRAEQENKRIFLVEHHLANYGFAGKLTVEKGKQKSQLHIGG